MTRKHEIRNSKQIQMLQGKKITNSPVLNFFNLDLVFFVSDFDIRISDLSPIKVTLYG